MGLITKEVEITLNSRNIKWFEDKGYEIKRKKNNWKYVVPRGTKIIAKVEDLSKGSNAKVDCECDGCKKPISMKWSRYLKCNRDGKIYCSPCINKIFFSGENNGLWNPNKTQKEREDRRHITGYKEFVQKVLARDNYTCVITGKTGNETELEVHHLDGYDWCIERRMDVTNAVTLSKEMHKAFHTKYGRGKNTKQQFLEFAGNINLLLDDYNGKIPTSRWVYCVTDNIIIKNVTEYARRNKLLACNIYDCCRGDIFKYKRKIYVWYDTFINMSEEEIKAHINKCEMYGRTKRVACVNYKLLFESSKSAGTYFNIDHSSITKCCRGKAQYAGKLANREKLIWKYATEIRDMVNYVLVTDEDIYHKNMRSEYIHEKRYIDKIVCIEYKTFFDTIQDASIYYAINRCYISGNLNGREKSGGKQLATNKPLHWLRYKDYIEKYGDKDLVYIPKEECEKTLLSRNQESLNDDSFIM